MDKIEQKDLKKKRSIENIWYNWSINYIPEPIRKTIGGIKDKVVNLFKTNTPENYGKQTMYQSENKPSQLKIQKQTEDNIIKSIRNPFKLKKENKAIKDRIIRDIRTLFDQDGDHYKPIGVGNFWNNNCIEYESNADRNKNPSLKEYLNEIKPYLRDIITDLQKSDT